LITVLLIALSGCVNHLKYVPENSDFKNIDITIKVSKPEHYHRDVTYFYSNIKLKNISNSEFILDLKSVKVFYNNFEVKELSIRYFNE